MTNSSDSELILKLTRLQGRIDRQVDSALGVHGISYSEFQVMRSLAQAPDQVMKRVHLADSVGLTASGVTRLLAPMEKIGIVRRESNARDARVSLVKLTAAGKRLFADAETTLSETSQSLVASLTASQKLGLRTTVDRMLA